MPALQDSRHLFYLVFGYVQHAEPGSVELKAEDEVSRGVLLEKGRDAFVEAFPNRNHVLLLVWLLFW